MTTGTGIVRWQSTVDPTRCGLELAGYFADQHRLEAELDKGLGKSSVTRPAFVFTSPGSTRAEDIASAVTRAADFSSDARMCVALDAEALCATDSVVLRKANVGILLDHVDADTPLSIITTDLIEAVRFDETFLRRAYVDSRSACVLAAMLGLAHDLGLATLGSVDEANSNGEFAFDYVVIPAFD